MTLGLFSLHPLWGTARAATIVNKAFVREPEFDGKAYCPRCGSLGVAVGSSVLDEQIRPEVRDRFREAAWFCPFARCEVGYFDLFETVVLVDELHRPIYPKDPAAPICACFGFDEDDIEADIDEGTPTRIRALLQRSQSAAADCARRAADGRCCMPEVQRLYLRRKQQADT